MYGTIREFENGVMARVYVMSITRSTMYQKAPFLAWTGVRQIKSGSMWVQLYQIHMRLINMRRFPASGNKESCLCPVFRPFTISDKCSFQTLCQMDISTFS